MNTDTPTSVPLLTWRAPSRPHHERSARWYVCAGIFVLTLLTYSIATKAWTFTLVIVLGVLLYLYGHREPPSEDDIRLWSEGCLFNGEFTAWNVCESYFFIRGRNVTELVIERKGMRKAIRVRTGAVSPMSIRQVLDGHLEEKPEQTEAALDTISRICKI